MAFNPDEYLAQGTPEQEGFNPDAYLGEIEPEEEKDYTKRVAQAFGEASGNIAKVMTGTTKRLSEGDVEPLKNPEMLYDALEIGGEVVEATSSLFTEAYGELPKDVRDKIERTLGESSKTLYNALNIGGGLDKTAAALTELAEKYPREAGALQDIMQISAAAKVKDVVMQGATKATPKKWSTIVTPAPTRDELKRRALDSTTNITGTTDIPRVQAWQKDLIKTLKNVKGVHPSNRNQVNLNAVINGISDKAKNLESKLGSSKLKLNTQRVAARIKGDLEREYLDNPIFDGATKKEIERAYNRAMSFVAKRGSTPKGLWEARKDLDKFYEFHKGEKFVSGSNNASVASESYRVARNSMNKILEKNVKGSREALKEMRNLYEARDILTDKAILDDPTLVGRMMDRAGQFVTIRPPVVRGGYYGPSNLPK